jgi:D-3-phosphoglycerate dehydrogenase
MREGRWIHSELRPQCLQLRNRTVGIVGLGNIGRMVARKLGGFEARVLYYDPVRPNAETERELAVTYVGLDELLRTSDLITLHCPGGDANHHLLDAAAFERMKPGVVLINAARGDLIDDAALVDALRSGKVSGAGLDVFEPEPLLPGSPYRELDNVVLTPHTAASVMDNVVNVARHAFRNMLRVANGEELSAADIVVAAPRPRMRAETSSASGAG